MDSHSETSREADARPEAPSNFIREIIDEDLRSGRHRTVATRFPPEPNGYLHIGHAKSICLNFGLARDYGGTCNLRFDDTNPETESQEYVESIMDGVRWLGFDWGDRLFFASDYFEPFYQFACKLIRDGKAYVDSLNEDEIRQYRGTVTEPGRPSPYRDRSPEENLDLFRRMRAGEFEDGAHVLRAKGDLASPNMKMRDPLLYRIKRATHYHAGDAWCIYPFYDFAHPLEDAIEGITHSLCTLEFDNNREIYDWVLENCLEPEQLPSRPRQYEFSRLNLDYTVMSKRKLLQLVQEQYVSGWDDPRMPTIYGLRRRGVTPEAIRTFCDRVGVTKTEGHVDPELLDHTVRDDLNFQAPRVMAVLRPLRVVLTNYPEGQVEWLDAPYWPHDVGKEGSRKIPFSKVLYIEQDDFMEHPPKKFFRLSPGREVRLRYGYFITCQEVVKDPATGAVLELRCTYDPATRGGDAPDGRRPRATLHWVSAEHALPAEVRLYDRLFSVAAPDDEPGDFKAYLNPVSLVMETGARVEPSVADDPADTRYQFERQGYFWQDPKDSRPGALVFNRIVGLRDTWAKIAQESEPEPAAEQPSKRSDAPAETPATREHPADRLPPLARSRFVHLTDTHGLHQEEAVVLAADAALTSFFEQALASGAAARAVAGWITHELVPRLKSRATDELPFGPDALGRLVALIEQGVLTHRLGRDVFADMMAGEGDPDEIVRRKNLRPVDDPAALAALVDRVVTANAEKAAQYRAGKTGLMGFFVGQVMRETGGKAQATLVQELLAERLA